MKMSFFKKINSLALSLKPPLIPCLSPAPHSSPQRKHHYQPEVCPLVSRRTHSILIFLQHDRPGERDRLEGTLFVPYSFFPLLFLLKESLKNRFPAVKGLAFLSWVCDSKGSRMPKRPKTMLPHHPGPRKTWPGACSVGWFGLPGSGLQVMALVNQEIQDS